MARESSLRTVLALLLLSAWMMLLMVYEATEDEGQMQQPIPSAIIEDNYNNNEEEGEWNMNKTTGLKYILFFTSYFDKKDYAFGLGQKAFMKHNCPINTCFATTNRSLLGSLSRFDAILFHPRNMRQGRISLPNQKLRRQFQRYVMFLMESPVHDDFPHDKFRNFFNWTITYRRDSDIYRPYGHIKLKEDKTFYAQNESKWIKYDEKKFKQRLAFLRAQNKSDDDWWKIKKGEGRVSWIVSNCHTESGRQIFAGELNENLSIDVMGNCGKIRCDKRHGISGPIDNCSARAYEHSRFYLSLENSLCRDYVTEKFFKRIANRLVPIVLNASASGLSELAPPHSYIDASSFPSASALAAYLTSMDEDTFLSYHWWREHYTVNFGTEYNARAMCKLCQMLHDPDLPSKSYADMNTWWRKAASCTKGKYGGKKYRGNNVFIESLRNGVGKMADLVHNQVGNAMKEITNHYYGSHNKQEHREFHDTSVT